MEGWWPKQERHGLKGNGTFPVDFAPASPPPDHRVPGGDRKRSFWRASVRIFAEREDPSGKRSPRHSVCCSTRRLQSTRHRQAPDLNRSHRPPSAPPKPLTLPVRVRSPRLRQLLESTSDIGITHFRREAKELLMVSRKALRYLLPTATLIVRSPEGTASPVPRGRPVVVPVPKQGRTASQTGGALSAPQRRKKRNRKKNRHVQPIPPTPAQISELVSKVDERALIKLQERFNTRRM